ncbi:MAG: triose-phosphate isomerase [Gammaproteobacteria bacterium]|nr:triose-phosphate isomerase [Gammaproteobacteria bacterium]
MNGSAELGAEMAAVLGEAMPELSAVDIVVSPPATLISVLIEGLRQTPVAVGAQNCHPEPAGAFTGEISAPLLKSAGCSYVIVGHSERRSLFAEDDALVADKCAAALTSGLVPVVCVGETLTQRKKGETESVIRQQIDAIIERLERPDLERIVVAYEPVWAIGTGVSASAEQAQPVHGLLRSRLADVCDSSGIRILYGGSMKPGNAAELLVMPDIDGGLIGGAALAAESFLGICRAAAELC